MSALKVVNLPSLPETRVVSPSGKYESFCRDVSLALGGVKDTGPCGGGHPFDLQQRRVPPGASVCPLHAHTAQWELFLILSGEATVRTGDGATRLVRAGDAFMQAPGTAHQITNTGAADLVFLVVADNPPVDVIHYPDSKKWMLKPRRTVFRMEETAYYDGEE